jgi:hypothetical protein
LNNIKISFDLEGVMSANINDPNQLNLESTNFDKEIRDKKQTYEKKIFEIARGSELTNAEKITEIQKLSDDFDQWSTERNKEIEAKAASCIGDQSWKDHALEELAIAKQEIDQFVKTSLAYVNPLPPSFLI